MSEHLAFAQAVVEYLPFARERWLVLLRPFILSALQSCGGDRWESRPNCVYVIVSTRCKLFYIGVTERPLRARTREHLSFCAAENGKAQRAHDWIARFGPETYCVLPLYFFPISDPPELPKGFSSGDSNLG